MALYPFEGLGLHIDATWSMSLRIFAFDKGLGWVPGRRAQPAGPVRLGAHDRLVTVSVQVDRYLLKEVGVSYWSAILFPITLWLAHKLWSISSFELAYRESMLGHGTLSSMCICNFNNFEYRMLLLYKSLTIPAALGSIDMILITWQLGIP